MLDWLDTAPAKSADNSAPAQIDHDSGEVRRDTIFPVSRFRETPEIQNREGSNPHGCEVFPVSRFSRFQNRGRPDNDVKIHAQGDGKTQAIPEHLPELLDAVAAILTAGELDHLRAMSGSEPDTVADACRLILTAPAYPTPEDVAELDGLMVRLCGLVPWLSGFLPEMQAARHRMAPADVADNLARFRRWVAKAETKSPAARLGAECVEPSAPKIENDTKPGKPAEKDTPPKPSCQTCNHCLPAGVCAEPVAAGLSDLAGVIRYHPSNGVNCPGWL